MTCFDDIFTGKMSLSFAIDHYGIELDLLIADKDDIIIHLYDLAVEIWHQDPIIIHSHVDSDLSMIVSFLCRHEIRQKEIRFYEIEEKFMIFDTSMS